MSEIDFEIRVPLSLQLAPLPSWVKLVWQSAKSYQGEGECCWAGYLKIGQRVMLESGTYMSKSQVAKGVKILLETPFMKRNKSGKLVCTIPGKGTTPLYPNSDIQDSTGVQQGSTGGTTPLYGGYNRVVRRVQQGSTPSKNQLKTNNKTNSKTKESKVFSSDSWQYEFASAHLDHLKRLGIAPLSALKDEPKTIQRDADVFDKLHRLDGHSLDEIRRVMRWLFDGSWWVESGNYASAKKLRDKKGDQTYFEKFKTQSLEKNGKPRNGKPRPASSKADFERIYAVALKAAGVDGVPGESPDGDFVRGGAGSFDDPR